MRPVNDEEEKCSVQDLAVTSHQRQPDKGLGKERRVHAAAWQKVSLCRLKPAFLVTDFTLTTSERGVETL
jgi:hypothetical protein